MGNLNLSLGNTKLTGRLVLAPLAGISDLPFRLVARQSGAALVCSEMISAHGLVYGNRSTIALLKTVPEERPLSVQLFGADPDVMGRAAAILSHHRIDVIDINMGCPVKKVVSRGAGAALLRDLTLARAVIKAVVAHATVPVTVKMRAGWSIDSLVAPELSRMAEGEGAAGIVIHGRTARQFFTGKARMDYIAQVVRSVSIPVIGNGDVTSQQDASRMMLETGCQGVMIGRGALGNPWIFSEKGRPSGADEIMNAVRVHLDLMQEHLSAHQSVVAARKHLGWYSRGMRGAAGFRKSLYAIGSVEELRIAAERYFTGACGEPDQGFDGHPLPHPVVSQE